MCRKKSVTKRVALAVATQRVRGSSALAVSGLVKQTAQTVVDAFWSRVENSTHVVAVCVAAVFVVKK
jgi:hypothetical protein